jgi:hypothetical protein
MSNSNIAEQRELRAGRQIAQQRKNNDTGEMYWVQIKLSWGKVYFSCDGDYWHRSAKAARLAVAA